MKVTCDYCGNNAKLVKGADLYQNCHHDTKSKFFWKCQPCAAWVGCHPASRTETGRRPFGRLANKELREMRNKAHAEFDKLWSGENSYQGKRQAAYAWLALKMGLPRSQTHIGMFNIDECKRVVSIVNERTTG